LLTSVCRRDDRFLGPGLDIGVSLSAPISDAVDSSEISEIVEAAGAGLRHKSWRRALREAGEEADHKMSCRDLLLFRESFERGGKETSFVIHREGHEGLLFCEGGFGRVERPF